MALKMTGPRKSHGRLSISASAKPRELMAKSELTRVWTEKKVTVLCSTSRAIR
jgi:hypothetical protein